MINPDSGVYRITNSTNGKCYIGSSTRLKRRISGHKSSLKSGKHENRILQSDYDLHGINSFEFEIIQYLSDVSDIVALENKLIAAHNSINFGYNRKIAYRLPIPYMPRYQTIQLEAKRRAPDTSGSAGHTCP